jgi:hypothetical protein
LILAKLPPVPLAKESEESAKTSATVAITVREDFLIDFISKLLM